MNKYVLSILCVIAGTLLCSCGGNGGLPGGSGLIEATEVVVSAEVSGQVDKLYVSEGNYIETGGDLVLIDTVALSLQLDRVEALLHTAYTGRDASAIHVEQSKLAYDLAEKEFNRTKRLLAKGSTNQQSFDKMENTYQQKELAIKSANVALRKSEAEIKRIEAEMAILKKQLSDCHPLAPAGGTVVSTYIDNGELLAPGMPIAKIAQLDTVWVKIYLPPGELTGIKLGDRAEIDPEDGRESPLTGHISWISPEAEFTPKNVQTREARADLLYAVKVTIANDNQILKIGMPVSVQLPGN